MSDAPSSATALVVDDEIFIAMDIADIVGDCGVTVLGPAISLDQAFGLIETTLPNIAFLDINIGRTKVWPLARRLKTEGCPIVFISANANHTELSTEFVGAPVLDKPVSMAELQGCVKRILSA